MKKISSLIIFALAITSVLTAQQVPQGMKYQAVARNLKGEILADDQIVLRISLTGNQKNSAVVYYSELHNVKTNELGLFTLVIGEGVSNKPSFKEVPWSSENIWMEVAIADKAKGGFTVISSSKLLAVPYAFHAETANKISDNVLTQGNKEIAGPTPSSPWTTKGNSGIMPSDYLGTSDNSSLIIKTNGLERMNVLNNGDVNVKGNVNLNTASGATINNGNLTVANLSATSLTGTLTVDKATNLNDVLNVNNQKATNLTGSLDVNGLVSFTDGTQSTSTATGALVVAGGVGIEKNLNVGGDLNVTGLATLKNLAVDGVTGKSINISDDNTSYLATFTNTNNGDGDGIKIKLGKTHPTWDGTSYKHITSSLPESFDPTIAKVNQYIDGTDSWSVDDLVDLIPTVVLAGSIIKLTNLLIPKINDGLGLNPDGKILLPQTTLYGGGSPVVAALTYVNGGPPSGGVCGSTGDCIIPDAWITPGDPSYAGNSTNIPALVIPEIKIPKIPLIPEDGLPTFSPFNLSFVSVDNSLTKQNEFLIFTDKDDRPLGRIRAQSLSNWRSDYLNTLYFMNLASTFVKTDILSAVVDGITGFSNLIDAYNSVGVEYTSGNGDYAEWLERIDPKEIIGAGDIVAIK